MGDETFELNMTSLTLLNGMIGIIYMLLEDNPSNQSNVQTHYSFRGQPGTKAAHEKPSKDFKIRVSPAILPSHWPKSSLFR